MSETKDERRNPDRLLEKIKSEGGISTLGKLKIYLGMAAGVGKTYAMLSDAQTLVARGVDVVIGYVEPHGRRETEQLLENLEQLPPLVIPHGGVQLKEFDLDAALKRAPEILLVDELAHTNAPGARHPKRWQDIAELLRAGISVYTTVNIQHLETMRDVVAQIAGVNVQETVPDSIFSAADEIEVIDLPPGELLQRLREGKIYPMERVDAALANFFKEGNLLALRELLLRHSAQRVDAQMQHFRRRNEVRGIWPARERLLVLIGATPMAKILVRYAQRLASNLDAELYAVTFESPTYARASEENRERAMEALHLAETLGARSFVRSSQDMVTDAIEFAREHNITSIVVGKPVRPRWLEFFQRRLVDELLRNSQGISIHVIGAPKLAAIAQRRQRAPVPLDWRSLAVTVAVCFLATALSEEMSTSFELSNLIMVYLLGVTWIASRFTYREAFVGSVLSVALFDFFFVPPRFTFAVADAQYLVTFGTMLGVSLLISRLTQQLKEQARLTSEREHRTSALYALGQDLMRMHSRDALQALAKEHIGRAFNCEVALHFPEPEAPAQGEAVAQWVSRYNQPAGLGTDTLPGSDALYLPLGTAEECHAVLKIKPQTGTIISFSDRKLMEAYAAQLTLGMERLTLEEQTQEARLSTEREQLKNILLSSISHDFRTPLTVISGASTILMDSPALPRPRQLELLGSIKEESERLGTVVRNVLDLTRFEAGRVQLKVDWYSIEELIGAALTATRHAMGKRPVSINLAPDLPLIKVDGALIQQLLVNLLENISKHTALETAVTISGEYSDKILHIRIDDNGPGFEHDTELKVFDKFFTGSRQHIGGIGLGLTICKTIAEAHGGSIKAENRAEGGARVELLLPVEQEQPHAEPR